MQSAIAYYDMMYHRMIMVEIGEQHFESSGLLSPTHREDWFERAAMGASMLCLVHCLALPLIIAALPALSQILAIPRAFTCGFSPSPYRRARRRYSPGAPGMAHRGRSSAA